MDSLGRQARPESAKKVAEQILSTADRLGNGPQVIKAKCWIYTFEKGNDKDPTDIIRKVEKEVAGTERPAEKAIWCNIAAKTYEIYISENRYILYDRARLADSIKEDVRTWDINTVDKRIRALYRMSLRDKDILLRTSYKDYMPIINKGKNAASLRNSLYDLLAADAIEYFSRSNNYRTNAKDPFTINDNSYFDPLESFVSKTIPSGDSMNARYQAIKYYQEILNGQMKQQQINALIDMDIARINFVYDQTNLYKKDSLYLAALSHIEKKYRGNAYAAQARYLVLNHIYRHYKKYQPHYSLKAIHDSLELFIQQYPESEGRTNAQNLLNEIEQQQIGIHTEMVNIPMEQVKALISYSNRKDINIDIHRINAEQYRKEDTTFNNLIQSSTQKLVRSEDFEPHSVEISLGAFPEGFYAVFLRSDTQQLFHFFQVSKLFPVSPGRAKNQYFILNSKNGVPEHKVKVWSLTDTAGASYKIIGMSDQAGMVQTGRNKIPKYDYQYKFYYLFTQGRDSLLIGNNYDEISFSKSNTPKTRKKDEDDEARIHHFLFTDRSIYRPGQTIYFKAIALKSKPDRTEAKVMPNESIEIELRDVNSQVIAVQTYKTNEFGSFSGSFTIPENALTGEMNLSTEEGDLDFSVEEYKRPRFFIEFDTIKQHVGLNTLVSLRGRAKTYAGNPVSGATVEYTIGRKLDRHYYDKSYEIADSIIITDKEGYFNIQFMAWDDADENEDIDSNTRYTFEINAEVTDLNGETRSKKSYVKAGYIDKFIYVNTPRIVHGDRKQQFYIGTYNINNVFVPVKVKVYIRQLAGVNRLYRKRLWAQPTDSVMSREAFLKLFPNDIYGAEPGRDNQQVLGTVWDTIYQTADQQLLDIDPAIWKPASGYYQVEAIAQDSSGHTISHKTSFFVLKPSRPEQSDFPLLSYTDKYQYQPGDTIKINIRPAISGVHLMQNNSWNKTYDLQKNATVLQKVSESDRGMRMLNWMYVWNGRIYEATNDIYIPWTNKELKLSLQTQRDKLDPNAEEEWDIELEDYNGQYKEAELLASMYDASLDELQEHKWKYDKVFESSYYSHYWLAPSKEQTNHHKYIHRKEKIDFVKRYPQFRYLINDPNHYEIILFEAENNTDLDEVSVYGQKMDKRSYVGTISTVYQSESLFVPAPAQAVKEEQLPIKARTNFNETAFFFPQLKTDQSGKASLKFTVPESLTEWRIMLFAHTKDWATGYTEYKVHTSKELMIMPNMPRIFRQGDEVVLSTKVSNISDTPMHTRVSIEIRDAQTQQLLNLPFGIRSAEQDIEIGAKQSVNAPFKLKIPQSVYNPVSVQLTARSGNVSDGERHVIPVLSNRILVTEALPIAVPAHSSEANFSFEPLLQHAADSQISHQSLVVEYSSKPAWSALQALPYLIEYPYDCTEQKFNKLFANALALEVLRKSPQTDSILRQWRKHPPQSPLNRNQDIKGILLSETPWLVEGNTEAEQQRRLADVLEEQHMKKAGQQLLREIQELQQDSGGFPWFSGMADNIYITQYLLTGIAKLKEMAVMLPDTQRLQQIVKRALPFLDKAAVQRYAQFNNSRQRLDAQAVQYLYLRGLYPGISMSDSTKMAYHHYLDLARKQWPALSNYLQGMIALSLNREGDTSTARLILTSLSERAVKDSEMGMYWKSTPGYYWQDDRISTQAFLVQAYLKINQDTATAEQLKTWLLRQKQTQSWASTTATAEACYAILQTGKQWTGVSGNVSISLGDTLVTKAGNDNTPYIQRRIAGNTIKPEMGKVKISTNPQSSPSWGAVYWQYYDNIDRLRGSNKEQPLQVEKKLFSFRNDPETAGLSPLEAGKPLHLGDKIMVRLVIHADRDMEYVHLKDMRASGFEPLNVLSQYKYQSGIGYYESTRDAATNFFFDRIPKGTWVITYPVIVNQQGTFANGIANIQCMYAPEFSSHSEGTSIKVND